MTVTTQIDQQRALLLADASLQAYNPFDGNKVAPPQGYDFIDTFTGTDYIFSHHTEEFGVVFRSQASPYNYIFAFRGTDSIWDGLEDLYAFTTSFVPWGAGSPVDATVASGFWSIYTSSTQTAPSMQNQLFALIEKYQISGKPVSSMYVTGHSLGGALSELFTLDLALSTYGGIWAANYNYASPMVGEKNWVSLYESQPPQQSADTSTLRVQNTYDVVPCLPGDILGLIDYQHVGAAYLIAFYGEGLEYFNPLARHSMLGYQAVLECAFSSPGGVCIKDGIEAGSYTIDSIKPNPNTLCSIGLADEFRKWLSEKKAAK